jgi:hypothetical protein
MMLEMKDLASGLAASFVAELANLKDLKVVPGQGTDWIKGRFNFKFRDVFEDYYAQTQQKGSETAPHILFLRCPDDVESIVKFTSQWGPLHNPRQEPPGSGFNPSIFTSDELSDLQKHRYFCFTPFWWRNIQQRFKDVIERLAQPDGQPFPTGMEYIPLHTHTLHFKIARQRDGVLAPQVQAGSLIEAFWLMLWLDYAEGSHRVRICANARCAHRIFRTERRNQIYCSERCKELVNKRKYWHRKGSDARRDHGRDDKLSVNS